MVTNVSHTYFVQDIPLVTQKPTEEIKANKSVTTIHKHETHTSKTKITPDENVQAKHYSSEEEETPKNQDNLNLLMKDKGDAAASMSEYESESFLESPTDDDVEKSILDHDSDLDPKPIHLEKQTMSLETKTKTDETNTMLLQQKTSKVCKCPHYEILDNNFYCHLHDCKFFKDFYNV